MASSEEGPGRAASYSARLSSFGPGGRRSSFGAKLAETVSAEGGELDQVLSMMKPSDHPTFKPFKVTTSNVDPDLFLAADEDIEVIEKHTDMCKDLHRVTRRVFNAAVAEASGKFYAMSKDDVDSFTTSVNQEYLARLKEGEDGERNAQAYVAMSIVRDNLDFTELIQEPVNLVLQELMALQDASHEVELKEIRAKTISMLENHIDEAVKGSSTLKAKNPLSQSQIHFRDTLVEMKKLFASFQALEKQYETAVDNHTVVLAELESGNLNDEKLDAKIVEASKHSTRSAELKKIKDHKMSQIFQVLEQRYPDIAGSAQNAQQQKLKSIAMHSLELDKDILTGKPDHTKSTKFIADLLQICQAWLPLFWSLIPALMEIQQHDDKVTPIKSLLFTEMKSDLFYGEQLGTIVETQASQLWLVVARGSVETMPALSMGSSEASLFSEIKTGGNGEEVRQSNVEHKNIISLVLYIKHYHEKDLIHDRRKNEAILNVAWAEFADGPILKACERLLVHWQAAMRLGSEVKWHAFMQKAIVALNDRCNGEMQRFLTDEYLNSEKLKSQYADNCLPLWNKFLSDVSNIARSMSSDSPKKYASPDVEASKSSLNAFAGTIKPAQAQTKVSIQGGPMSDWVCNAKDCSSCISQTVKDMIMSSRKKQGNNSTGCPATLLCETHHNSHIEGNGVTLKNGKVKEFRQRKNAKSNAVTTDGDSTGDEQSAGNGKKQGKRHKQNQKRKERTKKAMALLKEKEKAEKEPEESVPPAADSSDASKKQDFDPSSLSVEQLSKCVKLVAGLQMASTADASPAQEEHQEEAKEMSQASHGNVVKRLMGILSDNKVDPAQVVSSSLKANAAVASVGGNISDQVYIAK